MVSSAECSYLCNFLVFEAVNLNWVSLLKSARRNYSSIVLLNSLVQCNDNGESPLVVAMKGKNASVIKELVAWVTENDFHKKEECETMLILIIDQLVYHIPIVELMDYLMKDLQEILQNTTNSDWFDFLAQVFIQSTYLTRQDKIIALELIGASLILCSIYTKEISGLKYWREAMALRSLPADGEPLLPKKSALHVSSVSSSVVFGSAVEVTTIEELDQLEEDFERNYLTLDATHPRDVLYLCGKRMQIQALLVLRRISSLANLGHPHWLHLQSLRMFGKYLMYFQETLASRGDRKIMINTYLLILEQSNGFNPKMLSRKSFYVFMETLGILSNYFVRIIQEPLGSPEREEICYPNLLTIIKFITAIQCDYFNDFQNRVTFMELLLRFLFVLESVSPQMTNEKKQKLEKFYYDFIQDSADRTTTLLHVAVRRNIFSVFAVDYAVLPTIKLILKLGGDPNAIDEDGRTPLHILASMKEFQVDQYLHIFQALIDAGSHLDMAADNGETVLSILKDALRRSCLLIAHPYFESLMNTVFPLSCYAARVIRRNGIRFDGDRLPSHLQAFVQRHSAKDFTD